MRGLKASAAILFITIITCIVLADGGYRKADTAYQPDGTISEIVTEAGTFPGNIYYVFKDSSGIYGIKDSPGGGVDIYDVSSGKTSTFLKPIKSENRINAFCRSGAYVIWEEGSPSGEDKEGTGSTYSWALYLRKDNRILKIDENSPLELDTDAQVSVFPEKISAYGNYFVYKTYDTLPENNQKGLVIKLYDIAGEKSKNILYLADIKNTDVSEPYVYKNYVVWSEADVTVGYDGADVKSDIYLYNISTESCIKVTNGETLINPLIWEDYIICSSRSSDDNTLILLNFTTGHRKNIVLSDFSVSPSREVLDYSVGSGYVAWNTSYMDSVRVYDIKSDKIYSLDIGGRTESAASNLLNIEIYDKSVLYKNHIVKNGSGSTISETNKFIVLK